MAAAGELLRIWKVDISRIDAKRPGMHYHSLPR